MPSEEWVTIRFRVPPSWRRELHDAARAQGISLSGLLRLIVRGFMRNRYRDDERALLEAKP